MKNKLHFIRNWKSIHSGYFGIIICYCPIWHAPWSFSTLTIAGCCCCRHRHRCRRCCWSFCVFLRLSIHKYMCVCVAVSFVCDGCVACDFFFSFFIFLQLNWPWRILHRSERIWFQWCMACDNISKDVWWRAAFGGWIWMCSSQTAVDAEWGIRVDATVIDFNLPGSARANFDFNKTENAHNRIGWDKPIGNITKRQNYRFSRRIISGQRCLELVSNPNKHTHTTMLHQIGAITLYLPPWLELSSFDSSLLWNKIREKKYLTTNRIILDDTSSFAHSATTSGRNVASSHHQHTQ